MFLKSTLLSVLMILSFTAKAAESTATVKGIDQYRSTLEKGLSAGKMKIRMFVKPVGKSSAWKELLRDKDVDRICKSGCTDSLSVYRQDGKPLVATLETGELKGAWIRYIESYFRVDGSLALSRSDYRQPMPDKDEKHVVVQVVRLKYFTPQGKMIRETEPVYTDLMTKKDIPAVKLSEGAWPIFLHAKDLPVKTIPN